MTASAERQRRAAAASRRRRGGGGVDQDHAVGFHPGLLGQRRRRLVDGFGRAAQQQPVRALPAGRWRQPWAICARPAQLALGADGSKLAGLEDCGRASVPASSGERRPAWPGNG